MFKSYSVKVLSEKVLKTNSKRLQKNKSICIANEFPVFEGKYSGIIDTLRKNPYAKVVLAFLQSYMAKGLTEEIKDKMEPGEFMFFGSVAWGKSYDIIDGNWKLRGSLKLSLEMKNIPGFNHYMHNSDMINHEKNPWYRNYIESKYNCFMPGSFNKTSKTKCNIDLLPERLSSYKQENWTPYAYSAMTVFLRGANETFYNLCRKSTVLCQEYRTSPDILIDRIKKQKISMYDEEDPINMFDANGDGRVHYTLYNIQRSKNDPQNVEYVKIGESNADNNGFWFDKNQMVIPDNFQLPSTCPNKRRCTECFSETQEISESHRTMVDVRVAIVGITTLAVVLVVLIIVITVLQCRGKQKTTAKDKSYLQPVSTDHYDQISESDRQSSIRSLRM